MSVRTDTAMRSQSSPRSEVRLPLVTLGLPVYNGANFLREAIESILNQSYRNWELIISDNGSTDATEYICSEFAAKETRIRYYREAVNRGATWNFNRVFFLAKGPLFRWTAHDDICAPELLERCVQIMQEHPEVVLAHPLTRIIDAQGELICDYGTHLRTDSPETGMRFHDLICLDHACFPIFGVIRTRLLRRTSLLGEFTGSDRNLLAELALHGPFHEIPEFLFLRRDHPGTSTRQYPSARDRVMWFRAEGHRKGGQFPNLRRAIGYWRSIAKAPMGPGDRLACLGILGKWMTMRIKSLWHRNMPHAMPNLSAPEVWNEQKPIGLVSLKRAFNFTASLLLFPVPLLFIPMLST